MTKQYQWIDFVENSAKEETRKTKFWDVMGKNSLQHLGTVQWWSHWRRYCFFPESNMIFDANCLWDIADFIANATTEHKQKKTTV